MWEWNMYRMVLRSSSPAFRGRGPDLIRKLLLFGMFSTFGVGSGERLRSRDEPDELADARKECECAIATCKCVIINVKRERPDGRD